MVWLDTDGNGQRVASEVGRGGVTVQLLQGTTVIATTTTTAATGQYNFLDVAPGTYSVRVVPPSGMVVSPQGQGGDPTLDSDVDPGTGQSAPFTVVTGKDNTIDAGLFQGVCLCVCPCVCVCLKFLHE